MQPSLGGIWQMVVFDMEEGKGVPQMQTRIEPHLVPEAWNNL